MSPWVAAAAISPKPEVTKILLRMRLTSLVWAREMNLLWQACSRKWMAGVLAGTVWAGVPTVSLDERGPVRHFKNRVDTGRNSQLAELPDLVGVIQTYPSDGRSTHSNGQSSLAPVRKCP